MNTDLNSLETSLNSRIRARGLGGDQDRGARSQGQSPDEAPPANVEDTVELSGRAKHATGALAGDEAQQTEDDQSSSARSSEHPRAVLGADVSSRNFSGRPEEVDSLVAATLNESSADEQAVEAQDQQQAQSEQQAASSSDSEVASQSSSNPNEGADLGRLRAQNRSEARPEPRAESEVNQRQEAPVVEGSDQSETTESSGTSGTEEANDSEQNALNDLI